MSRIGQAIGRLISLGAFGASPPQMQTKAEPGPSGDEAFRIAMASGLPGSPVSDHRKESEQFRGWSYVAIHTKAKQAMQAECYVYEDEDADTMDGQEAVKRKSMRAARRDYLRKGYNLEQNETDPLGSDHPLVKILKKPNQYQSGASFRYEQIMQLNLTGTVLVWNVRNVLGTGIAERYVIPRGIVRAKEPSNEHPLGAWEVTPESAYRYATSNGYHSLGRLFSVYGFVIPADEMQVIRWPHPLTKDDGQSPVEAGKKWVDLSNMIDDRRMNHMIQGPEPSFAFSPGAANPWSPSIAKRVKIQLTQEIGGIRNAGQVFCLPKDSRLFELGTTPREMAYDESFSQMRDTQMALYGTPPTAAGITESASYAGLYASLKQFSFFTMQPELDFLAAEDTEQLAPFFGKGLIVVLEAKTIDDPQIREHQIRNDLDAGAMKLDEYRAMRGLPPVGGEEGERFVGGRKQSSGADRNKEDDQRSEEDDPRNELSQEEEPDENSTGVTGPNRIKSYLYPIPDINRITDDGWGSSYP